MSRPMKLKELDARNQTDREPWGTHAPIILRAQDSLLEIWSGEYDNKDTVIVLRSIANQLQSLATAIERNENLDDVLLDIDTTKRITHTSPDGDVPRCRC